MMIRMLRRQRLRIALLYTLFAVLAMIANLLAQWLVLELYAGPFRLIIAIAVGTIVGLPIKYLLDKQYIFHHKNHGMRERGVVFLRYTIFSGVTTLIFWGFEYTFELLFRQQWLTLLGGAIGLVIGYALKYRLDKHYVFNRRRAPELIAPGDDQPGRLPA